MASDDANDGNQSMSTVVLVKMLLGGGGFQLILPVGQQKQTSDISGGVCLCLCLCFDTDDDLEQNNNKSYKRQNWNQSR